MLLPGGPPSRGFTDKVVCKTVGEGRCHVLLGITEKSVNYIYVDRMSDGHMRCVCAFLRHSSKLRVSGEPWLLDC